MLSAEFWLVLVLSHGEGIRSTFLRSQTLSNSLLQMLQKGLDFGESGVKSVKSNCKSSIFLIVLTGGTLEKLKRMRREKDDEG